MTSKKDVLEDLKSMTDKLSEQVRTVALGVLALTWGLLIGDSATAQAISQHWKTHLLGIGTVAIGVIFLDFLQYAAGYRNARRLIDRMEKENLDSAQYDTTAFLWRLRLFFFNAKQFVLVADVIWLLYVVGCWSLLKT